MEKVQVAEFALSAVAAFVIGCGGGADTLDVSQGTVIQNVTVVNTGDGSPAIAGVKASDGVSGKYDGLGTIQKDSVGKVVADSPA